LRDRCIQPRVYEPAAFPKAIAWRKEGLANPL
jgi:hypothetical protein